MTRLDLLHVRPHQGAHRVALRYHRQRRGTKALEGGGCLMTQSIHIVDLLQHVVGGGASVGFVPPLGADEAAAYWDGVAAALHVHPQTVRYRMGQLRELYGERLDDPATVLGLTIALGGD